MKLVFGILMLAFGVLFVMNPHFIVEPITKLRTKKEDLQDPDVSPLVLLGVVFIFVGFWFVFLEILNIFAV